MLSDTEEAQVVVLRALFDLWKNHQQMMVVLVDKLLKTQIVDCSAVANWLFSKDMVSEFTKGYAWEMLHLTIRYSKHIPFNAQLQYMIVYKTFANSNISF